jgi:putative flavoprotein involved in K+ transport
MSTAVATPVAAQVQEWLARFDQALIQGETAAAAELFGEPSYWRDLVSFTWNIKTVEGPEGVKEMLDQTLANVRPSGWHTTEEPTEADGVIDAWIGFETGVGRGKGHLRLVDGKAFTLLTTLDELKGYEQTAREWSTASAPTARRGSKSASKSPRSSATRRSPTW